MTNIEVSPHQAQLILDHVYCNSNVRGKLRNAADGDCWQTIAISELSLDFLVSDLTAKVLELHEKDLDHAEPVIYELNELAEMLELKQA